MELKVLALMVALALVRVAADDHALDGCLKACGGHGGVRILYPFGVGKSSKTGEPCFFDKSFELTCNKSDLIMGTNISVTKIDLEAGQVDTLFFVSRVCYNSSDGNRRTIGNVPWLTQPDFTISSTKNKFISVGCDTYGYVTGSDNWEFSTGCVTTCYNNSMSIDAERCSGIGCCEVDIPPGMKNITIQTNSFENFNRCLRFNKCGYSFVAKNGSYTFSKNHLENLPNETFPLVLDWNIGNETCNVSQSRPNHACRINSRCVNSHTGDGYRCRCDVGYEGNPYHPDGCRDINECMQSNIYCDENATCINNAGGFECPCRDGYEGNGTKSSGKGCHLIVIRHSGKNTLLVITLSVTTIVLGLLVGSFYIYWGMKKRKLIKIREKFFLQNGGILLQQRIARHRGLSETPKIFTAEELKKATNNFDESRVLGQGGYGTVYKGVLPNDAVVAIKRSKMCDQNQIEQFINEVTVLSQISHRNVVKLLGCCLETEVPLLVYEFITNGTLSKHLHDQSQPSKLSWTMRLRIATETAGALSYLHSATSMPIIHRDVKTANILLDHNLTVKISDFGASRFVPLDQAQLATLVQGTFGYVDPEYFQTSQFSEKSDVYSFGVVLAELLTSQKALSFQRPESFRNLSMYFVSSIKDGNLLQIVDKHIMEDANVKHIVEVADLAKRCLRVKGEDRPTMKEVAMELEGLRITEKHPWGVPNVSLEETEYLLNPFPPANFAYVGDHVNASGSTTGIESINQISVSMDYGR